MELYKKLEADMKTALKNSDALRLSVLRMAISAIRLLEIEKKLAKIEDADVYGVIQKQIKQHKDSIGQFEKGFRNDLADKEKSELVILESYMPKQLSADEVEAIVKEVIADMGALTKAETGKVMKAVIEKTKGSTDGKTVNQIVLKYLK